MIRDNYIFFYNCLCVTRTDGLKLGALDGCSDGIFVGTKDGLVEDMEGVRVGVGDGARDTDGKNEGVLDGDVVVGCNDPVVMRATHALNPHIASTTFVRSTPDASPP